MDKIDWYQTLIKYKKAQTLWVIFVSPLWMESTNECDQKGKSGFMSLLHIVLMMTSSNGNIFCVTGPMCRKFTGHWWIASQRPVTWSFDVSYDLRLNKQLSNNHEAGDLRCHRAHDVIVMDMIYTMSSSVTCVPSSHTQLAVIWGPHGWSYPFSQDWQADENSYYVVHYEPLFLTCFHT